MITPIPSELGSCNTSLYVECLVQGLRPCRPSGGAAPPLHPPLQGLLKSTKHTDVQLCWMHLRSLVRPFGSHSLHVLADKLNLFFRHHTKTVYASYSLPVPPPRFGPLHHAELYDGSDAARPCGALHLRPHTSVRMVCLS